MNDINRGIALAFPPAVRDIRYIRLAPNARRALIASGTGSVRSQFHILDIPTQQVYSLPDDFDMSTGVWRWSPDNQYIIWSSRQNAARGRDQYIVDFDRRTVREVSEALADSVGVRERYDLPEDWGEIVFAELSPDERWLGFLVLRDTRREGYLKHIESGEIQPLRIDDRMDFDLNIVWLSWSPDSRYMAFATFIAINMSRNIIYLSDPVGGQMHQVDIDGINPRWSPDGQQLVLQAWEPTSGQIFGRLYLIQIKTGATGQENAITSAISGWQPIWSDDGEYLSYIFTADIRGGRRQNWLNILHVATNQEHSLTQLGDYVLDFAFWR